MVLRTVESKHELITLEGDRLVFHEGFEVEGPAVAAAQAGLDRGCSLVHTTERMLSLGGTLLSHGSNAALVDSVAAEVDKVVSTLRAAAAAEIPHALQAGVEQLEDLLSRHFDSTQTTSVQQEIITGIVKIMSQTRTEFVRSLADEEGPLAAVRSDLSGQLARIDKRQDVLAEALVTLTERLKATRALEQADERSTAKGADYETLVGSALDWAVSPYGDELAFVGDEPGPSGSKAGDFLIRLDPSSCGSRDVRVAVEAKAQRQKPPLAKALKWADDSMACREAVAAIVVFASADCAPLMGRSMRVFSGNRILVVFDRDDRNPLALEAAVHLARRLALASVERDDREVDADVLQAHIERLVEIIDEARAIKRGAAVSRKGLNQVDAAYERLRADAMGLVRDITALFDE
jgi:hypothetical protein